SSGTLEPAATDEGLIVTSAGFVVVAANALGTSAAITSTITPPPSDTRTLRANDMFIPHPFEKQRAQTRVRPCNRNGIASVVSGRNVKRTE
ncbi:MAG: hypothetical protein ACXVQT_08615, partial [Actinomycetota bacterium]